MLLSKAWEAFESDKRIKGLWLQLSLLIEYFKDIEITTLDTIQLKEYLAISGKHLKPASLAHRIRFLKSLFRWSHEEGNIRTFQCKCSYVLKDVALLD